MGRRTAKSIPQFDKHGVLPPGIHWTTWPRFEKRFANTPGRQLLIEGLKEALRSFLDAGCRTVYVDGSYVTRKAEPNDYDACWELDDRVDLDRLDPCLQLLEDGQPSQKAKYWGEFWPADAPTQLDVSPHLALFQRNFDTGKAKGIIAFDLTEWDSSTIPPKGGG